MLLSKLNIDKKAFYLLLFVTLFSLIYNIFLPAHADEIYYWVWGQHLALSYYDGPPLMAYMLRIATAIFGVSAWSVKLPAVICMSTSLYFIYRLAQYLFDERTAFVSLLLLIFMPIAQSGYVISTLDPALILFWVLTLYYFCLAIHSNKVRYRYIAGFCLGLCLLAKYPGVLLGVALFLFLLITQYRKQLLSAHWYLAAILALIVFSPVLIWNWQHHWLSFAFQYNHGVASEKHFQWNLLGNFLGSQLGVANPIFLLFSIYISLRHCKTIWRDKKLLIIALPFWVTFLFFTYQAMFKFAEANWAAAAYVSASILAAFFIVKRQHKLVLYSIVVVNIIFTIMLRFPQTTPFLPNKSILLRNFMGYEYILRNASKFYQPGDFVVSNRHQSAAVDSFYLPGHPQVYVLDNTVNQYYLWSKKIKTEILQGKIKSVLYIGERDKQGSLSNYFQHQTTLDNITYDGRWITRKWSVIRAWND